MKWKSRCVTSTSALLPENPVRYRTFGRLVSTRPSMCAPIIASRSAAMRAGRRSAIDCHRQHLDQAAQRQLVTVGAKSTDHRDSSIGERRAAPLGLTRVDVGEVYFDEWDFYGCQCIADRKTSVAVRAGVHERRIGTTAQRMNRIDNLPFAVVL